MKIVKLAIIGDYTLFDDYSNTKQLLLSLQNDSRLNIVFEYGKSNFDQKCYINERTKLSFIILLLRRFFNGLKASLIIFKTKVSDVDVIYVPYLSLFPLFFFSFYPKIIPHPKIIADGLISIYDTVVNDRKILSKRNIISKILWHMEKRSFDCADVIVVDTDANAFFYSKIFKIKRIKFKQIPLCIDESIFNITKKDNHKDYLNVLFAGGFIPLQGVHVIVEAAYLLKKDNSVKFHLIGNGQEAACITEYITKHNLDITWTKEWISIEDLAKEYYNADICLGIFGHSDKRGRVWPFKNYNAMATGTPVISSNFEDYSLPGIENCYYKVPPANAKELAKAILQLKDKNERQNMRMKGYDFYLKYLANQNAVNKFHALSKHLSDQT